MEVDGLSLNLETIFRHYEPSLGRWQSIDVATEEYFDYSPYNFALNDPVFFADPFGNDPWEDLINRTTHDPLQLEPGIYIRGYEGEVIFSEASTLLAEVIIEEEGETNFLQSRIDGFYGQLYGGLGGPVADLFSMVENPDEDLIRSFQNPIANQVRGGRAVAAEVIAEIGLTLAPLPKVSLLGKLSSKVLKIIRSTGAGNVAARGSISSVRSVGAARAGFTIADDAAALSSKLGKNSITLRTPTQQIRYDLVGKAHNGVRTPHKQIYNKNFWQGTVRSITRSSKDAIPLTRQEIRMLTKYINRL